MNNKYVFKKFNLILLSAVLCLSVVAFTLSLGVNGKSVKAETPVTTEVMLPVESYEYTPLTSPSKICVSDCLSNGFAILTANEICYYYNGEINTIPTSVFTTVNQIKYLNKDTLLVGDYNTLKTVKLADKSVAGLSDTNDNPVTFAHFDFNGEYLVTCSGTKYKVYSYSNGEFSSSANKTFDGILGDHPVCINENYVFFITDTAICYRELTSVNTDETTTLYTFNSDTPDQMVADENYIYCIKDNSVFSVKIADGSKTVYCFSDVFSDYDLGKITTPKGIEVKNGKLYLSDVTNGCVQEFEIQDDVLYFTGVAVAHEKTAYNRISETATDIERFYGKVAISDQDKLTVILTEGFDGYTKSLFNDFYIGNPPKFFAIGKTGILSVFNDGSVKFINTDTFAESDIDLSFTDAYSLSYQSGYFYVLSLGKITKIDEKDLSVKEVKDVGLDVSELCVDVLGDYHTYTLTDGVKDVHCDLTGKLFGVKSGEICYYVNGEGWTPTGVTGVKSIAMDFDLNRLYFIKDGSAEIFYTDELPIFAMNTVSLPEGFKVTGESASGEISAYKIKDDRKALTSVYSVTANDNGKITYNGIISQEDIYLKICDVEETNLAVLIGQQGTVIIDESQLRAEEILLTEENKPAFVSTGVNAYYYPVITKSDCYIIPFGDSDLRFLKGTEIAVKKSFNYLDRDFYFATVNHDGKEINCYIPADFTVEILSERTSYTFTIESVKAVTVYSDEGLTEKIADLNEGDSVRIYSSTEKTAKIQFKKDGKWSIGFIESKYVENKAGGTIKKVLIILAVITCICGSASYFILRKRKTPNDQKQS